MKKSRFLLLLLYLIILSLSLLLLVLGWSLLEILIVYIDIPSVESLPLFHEYFVVGKDEFSFVHITNESHIPSIIHQTWKSDNISTYPGYNSHSLWNSMYRGKNFEVKLWTDEQIHHLLKTHYPQFLRTYLALPQNIERADFARYLILYHEGGFYADLDAFPNFMGLEAFATFDLVIPYGTDGRSISNHFLGSRQGSEFLFYLLNHFHSNDTFLPLSPYFQVFVTSGPFFLQHHLYSYFYSNRSTTKERVLLLPREVSRKYFYHIGGRSWHQWDGQLFNFIGDYPKTLLGSCIILILMYYLRNHLIQLLWTWIVLRSCNRWLGKMTKKEDNSTSSVADTITGEKYDTGENDKMV